MNPTTLVYSSHSRCNYIHNDRIVQRALSGNREILFLPMSEGEDGWDEYRRQEFRRRNFEWYFNFFHHYGLNAFPFFWNSNLRREDVDRLIHTLQTAEVVILGGGNPYTGFRRYNELGAIHHGDGSLFGRLQHERLERGLLTVGFSAGVDQLCEYMCSSLGQGVSPVQGYGMCRNIIATSHFEHGREGVLHDAARRFGHCLVFGLPNDSGIAVSQGRLPSGNIWQVLHFITDNSWDDPGDWFHIKTRQGMLIQHIYPDGRNWAFSGGDLLVRIQSEDCNYCESFILRPGEPVRDYWSQNHTGYHHIGEILASH